MNARMTKAIEQAVPPILWRALRGSGKIRYRGSFSTWAEAAKAAGGYDKPAILEKVETATRAVLEGRAAFERDGCLFDHEEHRWPLVAALLWSAARSGGRLQVLDFGGALGSSFLQMRRFLLHLPSVEWSVVEQAHYVKAGRAGFETGGLRFFETIEQCAGERPITTALLSSVLQYLPDPWSVLETLARAGVRDVIIDRTLFASGGGERICLQHVPASIVASSYPCRFLSLDRLRRTLAGSHDEVFAFEDDLDHAPAGGLFQGIVFSPTGGAA